MELVKVLTKVFRRCPSRYHFKLALIWRLCICSTIFDEPVKHFLSFSSTESVNFVKLVGFTVNTMDPAQACACTADIMGQSGVWDFTHPIDCSAGLAEFVGTDTEFACTRSVGLSSLFYGLVISDNGLVKCLLPLFLIKGRSWVVPGGSKRNCTICEELSIKIRIN